MASKDLEAPTGSQSVEEEPHSAINPNEAAVLVHSLEEAIMTLEAQVAETEERNILNELVTKFKEAISRVIPAMAEAKVDKVVGSIKDPSCVAVRSKTEVREELLSVLMPLEDAPTEEEAMASIEGSSQLDRNQRELIRELFDNLEVAHEHTAWACSVLAHLSMTLTPPQLMATLRVATRPLIQVNTLEGLLDKIKTPKKMDLPEEISTRVLITMTPDPTSKNLQDEKINSPT